MQGKNPFGMANYNIISFNPQTLQQFLPPFLPNIQDLTRFTASYITARDASPSATTFVVGTPVFDYAMFSSFPSTQSYSLYAQTIMGTPPQAVTPGGQSLYQAIFSQENMEIRSLILSSNLAFPTVGTLSPVMAGRR